MRAFLLLFFLVNMPIWSMSADFCYKRAKERGIDLGEVKKSYRQLYGKKGRCYLSKHCKNPSLAMSDLRTKEIPLHQEKDHLESIRPRPAAALIQCDTKLVALALIYKLFTDQKPGEDSSYEDEDD